MRIKNKPIPFNEGEEKLLEWAEKQDKPFASYIKDLIREDMKKSKQLSEEELENIIKKVITKMNIDVKTVEDKKEDINLGEKGKIAYRNIMNSKKKGE
jgi:hypothetical protein